MENNSKTKTTKKSKKQNPMKKIGKGIKDTFIEMSSSLAGWIDDTGTQFMGKKNKNKTAKKTTSTTQQKSSSTTNNNHQS